MLLKKKTLERDFFVLTLAVARQNKIVIRRWNGNRLDNVFRQKSE